MEKVNKRRSALKKLGIGIAGIFGFSSIKAGEKPKKKIVGGFSGFGGFGQTQNRARGTNLRIRVQLSLNEIYNGVSKKIKVKRNVQASGVSYTTCSTCKGTGQIVRVSNTILGRMQSSSICNICSGSGKTILNRPQGSDSNGMILNEETVEIKI